MNPFAEARECLVPFGPNHRYPLQKRSLDVGSLDSIEGSIGASSTGDIVTVTSTFSSAHQLEQKQTSVLVNVEGSAFKKLIKTSPAAAFLGKEQANMTVEDEVCVCSGASRPTKTNPRNTETKATPLSRSLNASEHSSTDPRTANAYSTLEPRGIFAESPPLNLIRVWALKAHHTQFFYDCVCNARLPGMSLRNIKRHVYRHSKDYVCAVCKQEFPNHWSFNAHQKIHPARSPFDISDCERQRLALA